jgi:hypothetical protein
VATEQTSHRAMKIQHPLVDNSSRTYGGCLYHLSICGKKFSITTSESNKYPFFQGLSDS